MPSFSKKKVFGVHQPLHYRPFRTDRNNITTGDIRYDVLEQWNKPDWRLLDRIAGPALAGIPVISGVSCTGVQREYNEENGYASYTYTFEGIFTNAIDPEFSLDVTMREEPIQTHPNFDVLSQKYFWNSERQEFARQIVVDQQTGGLAGANDLSKRATSPMYGVTSFLVPSVTYRRSYAAAQVPGDLLYNIGTVVQPPGIEKFPSIQSILGGTRNWLKLAPKIRRRGACVEIDEEYMLSGPRGWNPDIYSGSAIGSNQSQTAGVNLPTINL
jgi:hypothetical protein